MAFTFYYVAVGEHLKAVRSSTSRGDYRYAAIWKSRTPGAAWRGSSFSKTRHGASRAVAWMGRGPADQARYFFEVTECRRVEKSEYERVKREILAEDRPQEPEATPAATARKRAKSNLEREAEERI